MAANLALNRKGYSEGKSVYAESIALLSKSIRFGWQREFYQAVALFNIKTLKESEFDGTPFSEFIKNLKISPTSAKRYVRIGRCLTQMMYGQNNKDHFLTSEILDKICDEVSVDEKITLRGLDKTSSDLNTFKRYLKGELTEENLRLTSSTVEILPEKSVAVKDSKLQVIESSTATPEALSVELWKRFEEKIEQIPSLLWQDIERHGKQFIECYSGANPEMREKIGESFRTINSTITKVKEILSALHRCDLADAEASMFE